MALLALPKPTVQLGGLSGLALTGAGTALGANTGLTVPWVPGLVVVVFSGATAAGSVSLVNPLASPAGPSITLIADGLGVFAPVPVGFAMSSGLVQVNIAVVTTASASAFLLPDAINATHDPFQMNPAESDF